MIGITVGLLVCHLAAKDRSYFDKRKARYLTSLLYFSRKVSGAHADVWRDQIAISAVAESSPVIWLALSLTLRYALPGTLC